MQQQILIGREREAGSPRLAVYYNDKVLYYGKPGSVPKNVSREHCKVTIDENGKITIEDLTVNNYMYVNGQECKKRGDIRPDDTIELGPGHFPLPLNDILHSLSAKAEWHIGQLEKVYDQYQDAKLKFEIRRGRVMVYRLIPTAVSLLGGVAGAALIPGETGKMVFGSIALVLFVLSIVFMAVKVSSDPIKRRRMDEAFRDQYRCPNPACDHFLGATPYKDLLKHKTCPYCKGKFIV